MNNNRDREFIKEIARQLNEVDTQYWSVTDIFTIDGIAYSIKELLKDNTN